MGIFTWLNSQLLKMKWLWDLVELWWKKFLDYQ